MPPARPPAQWAPTSSINWPELAHVANVTSAWTAPPAAAAALISKDGNSGLIVAGITGGENNAQKYAQALSDEVVHDRHGVTVRAGGMAMVNAQITQQIERDLLLMESIAIPLSFIVLVWVFGGLLAAALPMAVGVMAIAGSMAVLRAITLFTDVSIFALNLSTAMGLALAIDYTLLIISRYRDELANGADRDEALIRTMATAGRTVLFSATTVALSMAVMVLFPMYFLKSFAYARYRHRRIRRGRRDRGDAGGHRPVGLPAGFAGRAPAGSPAVASARTCPAPRRATVLVPLSQVRDAPRGSDRTGRRYAAGALGCPVPRRQVGHAR